MKAIVYREYGTADVLEYRDIEKHGRFVRMTRRGIHYNKVAVAMARELVGYLWATLYPREAGAPPLA